MEENFIEEPQRDDGAILRLASLGYNRNPTSNTTCAQFSKLLFFGGNLRQIGRSLVTSDGPFSMENGLFCGRSKSTMMGATLCGSKACSRHRRLYFCKTASLSSRASLAPTQPNLLAMELCVRPTWPGSVHSRLPLPGGSQRISRSGCGCRRPCFPVAPTGSLQGSRPQPARPECQTPAG